MSEGYLDSRMEPIAPPLVLTLKLDPTTFERVNEWRQQYFPPERNFLPAHVTLFHALPGAQGLAIQQRLQELCAQTPRLPLHFPTLRFLGRGVAVELRSLEFVQFRQSLATSWRDWLSPQDRQGYRPHITIQNKVTSAEARRLYEHLLEQWHPWDGFGEGLLLWHYLGGPWELVQEFSFISYE
ncbi:MAG: 2'-5' RNA ligase family protein [Leptolyngbyaceae bacterium]|nr:2'-5' RNA ligase family protein [Leptolyngbyaceae bacterium]